MMRSLHVWTALRPVGTIVGDLFHCYFESRQIIGQAVVIPHMGPMAL